MTGAGLSLGERVRDMYARFDRSDPTAFSDNFASDARMRFNDGEETVGAETIERFVVGYRQQFAAIVHEVVAVAVDPEQEVVTAETVVTYRRHDRPDVVVKGCAVTQWRDGRIREWRIYVDKSNFASPHAP